MEAHYGLSTLYARRLKQTISKKKDDDREAALYHLKRAIELGWRHWQQYTLKDDDFSALALGKAVSLEEMHTWDKNRHAYQKQLSAFQKEALELISRGEHVQALRLLYKSRFAFKLTALIDYAESKVMRHFLQKLGREKDSERDHEVEQLFGERGKIKWEWAKRRFETQTQK